MFCAKVLTALTILSCAFATPIALQGSATEAVAAVPEQMLRRAAGKGSYTIVSGDTGYALAAAYSITFPTLSSANPKVDWGNLQIGQAISMPSARSPIAYTVAGGDGQNSIASKYNVYAIDLANANPSINWNGLSAGSKLHIPTYGSYTTYTVSSGDTGLVIAAACGISFDALSSSNPNINWNGLQIGQMLTVPAGSSPSTGSLPSPASPPQVSSAATISATSLTPGRPSTATFITVSTTTVMSLNPTTPASSKASVRPTAWTSSAPGAWSTTSAVATPSISPISNGMPTVVGPNYVAGGNNNEGVGSRADSYTFYQGDGSTGAGWPDRSQWISFSTMWKNMSPFLGQSCAGVPGNSAQENQDILNSIQSIAATSGVDQRLILAVMVQESSGCVRVKTTISPDKTVTNPGLMQDFNGSGSCNINGNIQNPCPSSMIYQMVSEGTFGTKNTGSYQAGLVEDINSNSGFTGSQAVYRAARVYNSGSMPSNNDLGGPGATRCYASDIANRLMGWVSAPRSCTLDG